MKISENFILRKIADDNIVVPVGNELVDFNALITLNETGAFLWECLSVDSTEEELCNKLCAEFDVDRETAKTDIADFVCQLKDAGILNND